MLTHVHFHGTQGVDGETLVGIDGNTEEARIGIDQFILVPDYRVPENTSIIKISQASHIITAIKLGWIDLGHHVLLENFRLKMDIFVIKHVKYIFNSPQPTFNLLLQIPKV